MSKDIFNIQMDACTPEDSEPERGEVLKKLNTQILFGNIELENIAKKNPSEPQRFRGIAGSGKTHILCQKAAYLHCKYPDLKIVYTFFTRSLYEYIEHWIRIYCEEYGGDYQPDDPDRTLLILHAWGSKDRPGFYRTLCEYYDIDFFSAGDIDPDGELSPGETFAKACKSFLNIQKEYNIPIDPLYDVILIDEGQDFVVDKEDLLYEGKQPFYWMAYRVLKPFDPTKPKKRALIWAYDEYQNTTSMKIPTSKEIFGDEFQLRNSVIMKKCYRTPAPILIAAHAIGMGILFRGGMLAGPTTKAEWNALGYHVEGEFIKGHTLKICRPKEYSANIVPELWKGQLIDFQRFDRRDEEINFIARSIHKNLTVDHLTPDDILVVCLDTKFDMTKKIASELEERKIDYYLTSAAKKNRPWMGENPDTFTEPGCVTLSGFMRAKGNEKNMVYVCGLDVVARNEESGLLRNSLFIAITRSRAWVTLTISGNYPMYTEIKNVLSQINESGELIFEYKGKPKYSFNSDLDVEAQKTAYQEILVFGDDGEGN